MRDKILLRQLQHLPLQAKITMAEQRIREWYEHFDGQVCISFSGGKDSTVLTDLVHGMYPDVPLVFANTGLEYPEIQKFARDAGAEFVRPKMSFSEVISQYGYPIISKEVAEAIHFARRIVPQSLENQRGGGYNQPRDTSGERCPDRTVILHYERSRTELHGQRDDTERIAARKNRMETGEPQRTDSRPGKFLGGGTAKENSEESTGSGVSSSVKSQFNKLKWLPLSQETNFLISHYCCSVMKKGPLAKYQRKTKRVPYIGTMAEESRVRAQAWIRHGCNAFEGKKVSQPLSLWTEQDVLKYIRMYHIDICSVYGEVMAIDENGFFYEPLPGIDCKLGCTGCQRTGCVFCGFGAHMEKGETRFQRLARTHPKQYEYCMNGGQWVDNPKYDPAAPKMDGDWKNWNPKKIWVPSKEGLGMRKVFEDCNQIYGKDFIRFE